jgi:transposase-like protein
MVVRDACPGCGSPQFKKNGQIHSGKQHHQCKTCGRQFVASGEEHLISDEWRTLVEHLLCERISLHGICRAVGVSLMWLLHFMVERFAASPEHLHVQLPVSPTDVVIRQLAAEADAVELCPAEGEQAVDRHGYRDPPSHCLSRRGPQS